MLKIEIALTLVSLLLAACGVVLASDGEPTSEHLDEGYQAIENYLKEHHVAPDNVGASMVLAREWLASGTVDLDAPTGKALKQFTDLGELLGLREDVCTMKHLQILLANNEATGGAASYDAQPTSLVGATVHEYAVWNLDTCLNYYTGLYIDRRSQLNNKQNGDNPTFEQVEQFADAVFKVSPELKREEIIFDPNVCRETYRSLDFTPTELAAVLSHLGASVAAAADGESGGSIQLQLNKFILEPCRRYVDQLTDVFVPADLYASLIDYKTYENVRQATDYDQYYGWARFRLCASFIQADERALVLAANEGAHSVAPAAS